MRGLDIAGADRDTPRASPLARRVDAMNATRRLIMKKIGIVIGLTMLAAGVWVTGCGASGPFVCDSVMAGVHLCETISDPGSDSSVLAAACATEGGTTPASCATTGALGTCTETANGVTETLVFYSGGGTTTAAAQTQCTEVSGTWAAM
jgi:hypothetical protein